MIMSKKIVVTPDMFGQDISHLGIKLPEAGSPEMEALKAKWDKQAEAANKKHKASKGNVVDADRFRRARDEYNNTWFD
jgi:hypothetical protein